MKKITLITFVILFSAIGCVEKKSNSPSKKESETSSSSETSSTPTLQPTTTIPAPNTTNCYAPGIGDQVADYYTLTPIIFHGNKEGKPYYWSSATAPAMSLRQNNFVTDHRFSVRVIAKPAPSQYNNDSYGHSCDMMPLAYTKLKVTLGVRLPTVSGYTKQYTSAPINVGECSEVFMFHGGDHPETDGPLAIDIIDAKWDYACISRINDGNPTAQECTADNGMWQIWLNDCVQLELQVATDYTKDIPY